MKKLLIGIIYLFILLPIGNAQVIQHNIPDDGFAHVPLQFGFPYYGRIFTDSFMFSNGVVGFGSVNNHWCCTGHDLRNVRGYEFNFSIMPLQTDLINYQGRFLTEGTPQYQRYKWENISEFGVPNNLNTFGVEIRPSGFIGMYYEKVNISSWRPVTIGMTGDTTVGEYTQHYHGAGFSSLENVSYITQSTGDRCLIDPLSSPQCPNYAQAYQDQQCSINPLYSPVCSGYEVAYFNQQCRVNPLYDRNCAGYSEAYALANIVPTASNQTVSTTTPSVQVSTTGTVSVETPIVADPVVNEVITRTPITTPTTTQSVSNNIQNAQNVSNQTQNTEKSNSKSQNKDESKSEKKVESKQIKSVGRDATNNESQNQSIPQPAYEYKAPIILDLAYRQMVKKPIKDNNRAMYSLIMNSQHKHEEMVDEQYRRKGN